MPNSPTDRFVCVLGRVKHSSHSDQELTYSISLSRPVAVYTSLFVPVAVRWQRSKGEHGWREGELKEGRFL